MEFDWLFLIGICVYAYIILWVWYITAVCCDQVDYKLERPYGPHRRSWYDSNSV